MKKKTAKKQDQKLKVKVSTVRPLRDEMTKEQLNAVIGGAMALSGTPQNC